MKVGTRRIVLWTAGAIVALTVSAVAVLAYLFPIFELPAPSGAYAIGTRQFDMLDPARVGVLEDAPDMPRRILIRAWYPARDVDRFARRPYFTAREASDLSASFAVNAGFPSFLYRHLRFVRTHSHEGAPLAAGGPFPVVVFSHGYWCWPGQNTALMERLASHGYLVLSIAHPHDAATIEFADGTVIRTTPFRTQVSQPAPEMVAFWTGRDHEARYATFPGFRASFDRHRLMQSFDAWRGDTRFLVDALEANALPASMHDLAAASDLRRLAFVGMSFGGTTSASACHADVRCKAAVNLDGGEFDWSLYNADIRVPLLMLHSDWTLYGQRPPDNAERDFNLNDYAYETWERAGQRGDIHRVRVMGLRHLGFTDLPLSARMPVRERLYGRLDGELAVAAVNDLVLGFLDTYVEGRTVDFPAADFARHPQAQPHDASGVRSWWRARGAAAGSVSSPQRF